MAWMRISLPPATRQHDQQHDQGDLAALTGLPTADRFRRIRRPRTDVAPRGAADGGRPRGSGAAGARRAGRGRAARAAGRRASAGAERATALVTRPSGAPRDRRRPCPSRRGRAAAASTGRGVACACGSVRAPRPVPRGRRRGSPGRCPRHGSCRTVRRGAIVRRTDTWSLVGSCRAGVVGGGRTALAALRHARRGGRGALRLRRPRCASRRWLRRRRSKRRLPPGRRRGGVVPAGGAAAEPVVARGRRLLRPRRCDAAGAAAVAVLRLPQARRRGPAEPDRARPTVRR